MFEIELFNKSGHWQFLGLLFGVGKAAKLLRVHTQLPGHLNVGMRKMVSLTGINPSLVFLRYLFLFCHSQTLLEIAFPAKVA